MCGVILDVSVFSVLLMIVLVGLEKLFNMMLFVWWRMLFILFGREWSRLVLLVNVYVLSVLVVVIILLVVLMVCLMIFLGFGLFGLVLVVLFVCIVMYG